MRHKFLDLIAREVNKQGTMPFRLTLLNDFQKRVQENHNVQGLGEREDGGVEIRFRGTPIINILIRSKIFWSRSLDTGCRDILRDMLDNVTLSE